MNQTTNPGLLYSRFYFDDQYDEVLDQASWLKTLEQRHEAAEDVKEKEHEEREERNRQWAKKKNKQFTPKDFRRATFRTPRIGGFSQKYLLDPPDKKRQPTEFKAYNNHFSLRNHQLFTTRLTNEASKQNREVYRGRQASGFELTTTYPGLLVGLGYSHAVSAEQALNAGFSFDHTTGLPVIPGATVKGILRSVFPQRDHDRATDAKPEKKDWYRNTAKAKIAWLQQALTGIVGKERSDKLDLKVLEAELFDSRSTPLAQPIFHDALVVAASGDLFGPDNITPHVHYAEGENVPPDRYKNPTPISMLKVMPGVSFSFAFRLPDQLTQPDKDGKVALSLTAEEIRRLFQAILLEYGVGAKSRLNYGRFVEETIDFPSAEKLDADLATFRNFETEAFRSATITDKRSNRQQNQAKGNDRERRRDEREDPKLRAIRREAEQRKREAEEQKNKQPKVTGKTVVLTYEGKFGKWHSFKVSGQTQKLTLKSKAVMALAPLEKGKQYHAVVTARDSGLPGSPVIGVEFIAE
ncbi:type III-B CRISPR module RAMP protein Cmr6 [Neolewinella agarilytica]|uniref:CRISPR type III-B/RAMP module RAMP protein Cmr6 n=1 Tax=Neolewinella agarilytica TaxID=478744 RepID=A0A1H9HCF6_9BACT|nr:type III-B CRISPR module RAMP protein Cmr6 [Neolewinella agarilytica]SEQ59967.1 CRISPR type III-B/RAMP module RAMP protein Cmr6 [Neolewinella agarilytica]